jgi:hypothetical protein
MDLSDSKNQSEAKKSPFDAKSENRLSKLCADLDVEESKRDNWDGISRITLTDIQITPKVTRKSSMKLLTHSNRMHELIMQTGEAEALHQNRLLSLSGFNITDSQDLDCSDLGRPQVNETAIKKGIGIMQTNQEKAQTNLVTSDS